jgi:hypothetical protein
VSNRVALLLIGMLAVSTLVMIESAFAQSIPKPSVPEFTLKLVDNSYDVPPIPPTSPTYTKDPYSGKQIILSPGSSGVPGYHVENKTIELWIKNQQYSYSNGSAVFHVYFDVRTKGHFGENWTELNPTVYLPTMRFNINFNGAPAPYLNSNPIQSNSDYTILSFNGNYAAGDQVDFQAKAMIGHESQYYAGKYYGGNFIFDDYFLQGTAFDVGSDWSPTQTITIPASAASSPFQLDAIIGTVAAIVVIGAGLLVYWKKRNAEKTTRTSSLFQL